jgi:uncharacterized protein (DUF305 family)
MRAAPGHVAWIAWGLTGAVLAGAGLVSRPAMDADATFYTDMQAVDSTMHHGMAITPGGDVDRDFLRMMIPHHQGAIDMAIVLLKYGRDEKVRRLAQSIIVEQGQEITYMRMLLEAPPVTTSTTRPADR